MKFTLEQFRELGTMGLDDFPFNPTEDESLWIFNSLSNVTKGSAVSWGLSDTEVRENIFEELIKRIGFSCHITYYNSDIYKKYVDEGKTIPLTDLIYGE